MARESFEDLEIADILNKYYVSVKVDKEERPDIDSIYMAVCQAFTGRGGWPVSIFMTAEQKPFFAGTYFPKTARYGAVGLKELLLIIQQKWKNERDALLAPQTKSRRLSISIVLLRHKQIKLYRTLPCNGISRTLMRHLAVSAAHRNFQPPTIFCF